MFKTNLQGAQKAKNAIKKEVERITSGASSVLVGFPEGSGSYDTGETIAGVAAYNEFGTERIPARPFLRLGVESGAKEYEKIIRDNAQAVIDGEMSMDDVLKQLGELARAKVQEYIIGLSSPANAGSTVRRKKSSNPLIDTSNMVQNVTYVLPADPVQEGI